jgi:hypothetical protein
MGIVVLLVLLAAIVFQILLVIKMFKHAGALHGIIGLLCGLYALVWGWMNANKFEGVKNIVLIYTVLLVLYIILAVAFGGFSYASMATPTGVTP